MRVGRATISVQARKKERNETPFWNRGKGLSGENCSLKRGNGLSWHLFYNRVRVVKREKPKADYETLQQGLPRGFTKKEGRGGVKKRLGRDRTKRLLKEKKHVRQGSSIEEKRKQGQKGFPRFGEREKRGGETRWAGARRQIPQMRESQSSNPLGKMTEKSHSGVRLGIDGGKEKGEVSYQSLKRPRKRRKEEVSNQNKPFSRESKERSCSYHRHSTLQEKEGSLTLR